MAKINLTNSLVHFHGDNYFLKTLENFTQWIFSVMLEKCQKLHICIPSGIPPKLKEFGK